MLFSSLVFLFGFLFIVLFVYYIVLKKISHRNIFLCITSLLFYAWGEPKFVFVMILSIIVNYMFGIFVDKYRENSSKCKIVMFFMLMFNISLIFVFKYLMFFITTINSFTGLNFTVPIINLPIGISFFTFQSISYVIDIYRNNGKVQKNVMNVGLYISFFPQLIAGPIVRYETIAEQIKNRKETIVAFSEGTCRFVSGLVKKILLSNQLALVADAAFAGDGNISFSFAWLGIIAYALQIYYDFSGYSDMAIGLGKMFGFEFNENFNFPYISKSVTEFWRRWHISLSTWFRDYVYIPLGGNRVKKSRMIFNLLVVWLLTGIWHGASWNFIFWGIYYFIFLVIEKTFFANKNSVTLFQNIFGRIYTLIVICFGWVLFRAENLNKVGNYCKSLIRLNNIETELIFYRLIDDKLIFLIVGGIFAIPICKYFNNLIEFIKTTKLKVVAWIFELLYPIAYICLFIVCVSNLMKNTYNPFIYFNF